MTSIRYAARALALGFWPRPGHQQMHGRRWQGVVPGRALRGPGEKIKVRPAMEGATPHPAPALHGQEGAFGASWQRRHYLQNQGIPQARAALERHQRECAAQPES